MFKRMFKTPKSLDLSPQRRREHLKRFDLTGVVWDVLLISGFEVGGVGMENGCGLQFLVSFWLEVVG